MDGLALLSVLIEAVATRSEFSGVHSDITTAVTLTGLRPQLPPEPYEVAHGVPPASDVEVIRNEASLALREVGVTEEVAEGRAVG